MVKEPQEYVTLCHNEADSQYHDLLAKIMKQPERGDRTGTGTRSLFGYQMRFTDLANKFPLITTKKIHMKSIIYELLWMLKGDTNIKYLKDNGVTIWDEWADQAGELGPVYGKQWRNFDGADQVVAAVTSLIDNPNNRRNIVSAWNPAELGAMALPPCHLLYQFYTREMTNAKQVKNLYTTHNIPRHYLDCQVYIRSNDTFLGAPFNIAQYALLTHLFAKTAGMVPGELIYTIGDAHIYSNHYEQVTEQLSRSSTGDSPKLTITGLAQRDPADYEYDQVKLENYVSHAAIKGEVAV